MEQASMCAHISMLDQFAKDFNDSSSIYSMGSRQALAKKVLLLCSPHQMFVFFFILYHLGFACGMRKLSRHVPVETHKQLPWCGIACI